MNRAQQTNPKRPSVLVVDDCSQTRSTFALAFTGLKVVATFATVDELLAVGAQADVVILDLMLNTGLHQHPTIQGPPAVEALVRHGYRVCVYSAERRPLILAHCLAAGATGLVRKCDSLASNQSAFIAVAAGQPYVAESLTTVTRIHQLRGGPPKLTLRQRQVINARARGESWQHLADRLGISAKTAYDRLEAARNKLAVHLQDVGLPSNASPADIERSFGLGPGDLMEFPH